MAKKFEKKKRPDQDPVFAAPLPSNIDAEQAVLGSILLNNDYSTVVFSLLRDEDFFVRQNQTIFRYMQTVAAVGDPIDIVTLTAVLQKSSLLEQAGGAPYIAKLCDGIPKVTNIVHYCKIVREYALLRRLVYATHEVQQRAFFPEEANADAIVEYGIQQLLDLSSKSSASLVRSWQEVAVSAVEQLQNDHDFPNEAARIFCGISDLDDMTNGLRKKELVIVVGPTSNGKTLLALQFADRAARDGYRGIIFSAEMPGEQIVLRQLAFDAKVEFWKTRRPERMNNEEIEKLREQAGYVRPLTIVEKEITPMKIWAMSEAIKRTQGLDFIVVDYDQLVVESGIEADDEESFFRHQRRFILEGKHAAERLDVCLVILSQLRKVSPRVAQGGKPTLDDIYGDSSIRNTPNLIIWVVREYFIKGMKKEFERKAKAWIVKSRNDRTGFVNLEFDPVLVRFLEAPPSEKDSTPDTKAEEKKNEPEKNTSFRFEE